MATTFVSYSRLDQDFVLRLKAALAAAGHETWIDVDGLRPSEQWRARLESAIDGARAVLIVLSPDWLASSECRREFEHAARGRKKLVPIVWRDIAAGDAPEVVREINWIYWRAQDDAQAAAAKVAEAIDTDLEWVDRHTAFLNKARAWDERQRRRDLLLRGAELKESEDWIAQAAAHPKMPPSALHAEYILAGRRDATRRQRVIGAITAGMLLVSSTLGGLAFQQQRLRAAEGEIANKEKERLTATSEAATAQANEATAKGRLAEAEAEKARQAEQQQAELKQEQSSLRQVAEGYRLIYRDPIQAAVHALRAMQDKPSADAERAMTDAWRVAVAQRANRMVTMTLKDVEGISFEKRERPGEVYSVIGRNGRHILLATERKGSAFSPQLPGEVYLLDSETLRTTRLQACGKGTGQPRLEYAGFSSAGDRVFVTRAFYVDVYNLEGRCMFDRTLQFQSTKSPVHIVGGFLAKHFLLGSDSQGRVWLLDTRGQLEAKPAEDLGRRTYDLFSPGDALIDIKVAPDGHRALVLFESGRAELVHVASDGSMTHAPLAAVVLAAAFQPRLSAASARWASGQADGNVRLWQAKGEKPVAIQRLAHGAQPVDTLAYSEDGSVLVTIDARCTMRLWDADRGTLLHEMAAARGTACETSARVAKLRRAKAPMAGDNVSATTVPPVAMPAVLPSGARIVARMTDAHAEILALTIAPDGRWLAAGGEDGAIHLWDMQTYRLVRTWSFESFDAARALAISPDSATLVASSRSGKFGHWHLADGRPQPQGPPSGQRTVEALAFIAPGVLALASNADGVRLWDFARSTYTTAPVAGLDRVSYLVALPDGRRVVAGRQTGPPIVFDSLTGRLLDDAEAGDSSPLLAMDARGQALASSDGKGITLWTVSPLKRAERSFVMPGARVTSVALSPDARVIAAGLGNGALRLWSVETGRVLADLAGGHDATPIDALRFSPDGRTLVSGGGDHKVVVWSLTR